MIITRKIGAVSTNEHSSSTSLVERDWESVLVKGIERGVEVDVTDGRGGNNLHRDGEIAQILQVIYASRKETN